MTNSNTDNNDIDEFYAVEALTEIHESDLESIEVKYKEEQLTNCLSTDTEFEYGWALVRSPYKSDRLQGIHILSQLLVNYPNTRTRDCLYYLAVGHFRCKQYEEAMQMVNRLLRLEPHNQQAASLRKLIEKRVRRDGLIGATMVGGLAFIGAVSLASFVSRMFSGRGGSK